MGNTEIVVYLLKAVPEETWAIDVYPYRCGRMVSDLDLLLDQTLKSVIISVQDRG